MALFAASVAPAQPPPLSPLTRRWLPWLAAAAFFLQMLDATAVHTALPQMARALGVAPLAMQAVVTSYLLATAVVIPLSGWLCDRLGTRLVFQAAVTLFCAASLACALAPTLNWLVAARVAQGVGGALMLPVARLTVLHAFPRDELLGVLSFVAMAGLVGPLLGPPLGGLVVQWASWQWIFLINLPIGLAGVVLAARHMPDLRLAPRPLDALGWVVFSGALVALLLGLQQLRWPWLLSGVLALGAFAWHSRRSSAPLFARTLAQVASFRVGIAGNLWTRLGNGAMPFAVPLFLQLGLGWPPLEAGLALVPVVLGGMAAKRLAVPVVERLGYRLVLVANTLALGASMASFAAVGPYTPRWAVLALLTLFGLVNSMQFSAMNAVTLKDLHGQLAGDGNALLSVVMQMAATLGVASASQLLATFGGTASLGAFAAMFACLGVVTATSALVFARLAPMPAPMPTSTH